MSMHTFMLLMRFREISSCSLNFSVLHTVNHDANGKTENPPMMPKALGKANHLK